MAKLDLAAPWTTFYRQMQALFKKDEGVKVIYDPSTSTIKLYVENPTKAQALTNVLPATKQFGNITVNINVIPGNGESNIKHETPNFQRDIVIALEGNKAVSFIQEVGGLFATKLIYVVFVKEVVQFYNDDLTDIRGLCHTIYQDIANTIFDERPGVFFCTDIDKNSMYLGKPLGEWP